jgi:hypothetical protein
VHERRVERCPLLRGLSSGRGRCDSCCLQSSPPRPGRDPRRPRSQKAQDRGQSCHAVPRRHPHLEREDVPPQLRELTHLDKANSAYATHVRGKLEATTDAQLLARVGGILTRPNQSIKDPALKQALDEVRASPDDSVNVGVHRGFRAHLTQFLHSFCSRIALSRDGLDVECHPANGPGDLGQKLTSRAPVCAPGGGASEETPPRIGRARPASRAACARRPLIVRRNGHSETTRAPVRG